MISDDSVSFLHFLIFFLELTKIANKNSQTDVGPVFLVKIFHVEIPNIITVIMKKI